MAGRMHGVHPFALLLAAFLSAVAARPNPAGDELAAGPGAALDSAAVYGIVVEARSGEPVPRVNVRVVELDRSDWTHDDGRFHLDGLPPGRYTLVFTAIGYEEVKREISVSSGDRLQLRIEMPVAPIRLSDMDIIVQDVPRTRLSEDSTRVTTVLRGQELNRRLDVTIASTLEGQAGVAVASNGPATARPVIRGLGGDRILILEDGGRTGDLSFASPDHAVAIEAVTATEVEVLRGPAALLHGSNALGGIVNVIREEIPTEVGHPVHGSLIVQGQSVNTGIAGGGYVTGSRGPLALRFEASGRRAGDLYTPLGELENTGIETLNLSAGASWNELPIAGPGHIGGAYRYYWSEYGIPAYGDHHHHEGDHEDEGDHEHDHAHEGVKIRMRRHTARGQAQIMSLSGPFVWLKLDGAYTDYRHEEVEAAGEVGTEFALRSATVDLQARHDRSAFDRSNGTTIGIQALWSDYRAGGSIALTPTKEYGLAAYLVDERSPSFLPSRVRLQIGARYDWRRVEPEREGAADIGVIRPRDFGAFTASVGALYDLADGFTLGASVSRAFRTPNANELFSEGPHLATYSYEVGNPDLEEETGLGVDVFLRLARERLRGEVAVFRNGIDDYIYARNTGELSPTGLPVYQHVNGDAVLTGFEGSAQWRVTREFVVDGTVSYVRGTLTATDEPLPQIPPLQGRLGARYETERYFVAAGWKGAARQDRVGEFETPTDGYGVFDASAGVRWSVGGQLHTLTLRVDNITNEVYRDHLSRIKEIMPQAGRGASLLYRVNF
ncbi:MAG: TonB-dependent receptor [Gemmatimonadota bacterium]